MDKHLQKWLKEFREKFPGRKILFLCHSGSRLFGLDTPQSDQDYTGVYLPAPEEFLSMKNPFETRGKGIFERKTGGGAKNGSEDVDLSIFGLDKFLALLARGDFNMMELLHCPEDKIIADSGLMRELRRERRKLLARDASSFLGFVKKEYHRYGVNIHHYRIQKDFAAFLRRLEGQKGRHATLLGSWEEIREYSRKDPNVVLTESNTGAGKWVPTVKVAHRFYQGTTKLGYVAEAVETRLEKYGARGKNMASTGKEFKGLYHALRLIREGLDLYSKGELTVPPEKSFKDTLMAVKTGKMEAREVHRMVDEGLELLSEIDKKTEYRKQERERIEGYAFNLAARMRILAVMQKGRT